MLSARLKVFALAAVMFLCLTPVFADAGFDVHSYMFLGSQGNYTYPSAGADFLWRTDVTWGIPLRVGFNAGADWYFLKPTNTTQSIFIALPLTVNAAVTFMKAPFTFRAGLGAGPYLSIVNYTVMGISVGVTPLVEPFLEFGFSFGGFDIVVIPAYDAILDFLNPGGSYVQQVSLRVGMMFK